MVVAAAELYKKQVQESLNIAQILVSVLLIITILLQVRGLGTGLFGSATSSFRVRRGVEKTLFQLTIVLVVVFIVMSVFSFSLAE